MPSGSNTSSSRRRLKPNAAQKRMKPKRPTHTTSDEHGVSGVAVDDACSALELELQLERASAGVVRRLALETRKEARGVGERVAASAAMLSLRNSELNSHVPIQTCNASRSA